MLHRFFRRARPKADEPAPFEPLQEALDLFTLVNCEREHRGFDPLTLDHRLTEACQKHIAYLASIDVMTHFDAFGRLPYGRAYQAGVPCLRICEMIVSGVRNPKTILKRMVSDPLHCDNIRRSGWTIGGAGFAQDDHGRSFWVLCLAADMGPLESYQDGNSLLPEGIWMDTFRE